MENLQYLQNHSTDFDEFRTVTHVVPPDNMNCQNIEIFKNLRWQMAPVLKNVKRGISATIGPILMKFGKVMHICTPNDTVYQKFKI